MKELLKYLLVFFGGWKLFESGGPILIKIGVSLSISLIIYAVYCVDRGNKAKIK